MWCGILKVVLADPSNRCLILVVVALKQLILLVGFSTALKVAIIVVFVAVLVMIGLAIWRDRCRRRNGEI